MLPPPPLYIRVVTGEKKSSRGRDPRSNCPAREVRNSNPASSTGSLSSYRNVWFSQHTWLGAIELYLTFYRWIFIFEIRKKKKRSRISVWKCSLNDESAAPRAFLSIINKPPRAWEGGHRGWLISASCHLRFDTKPIRTWSYIVYHRIRWLIKMIFGTIIFSATLLSQCHNSWLH